MCERKGCHTASSRVYHSHPNALHFAFAFAFAFAFPLPLPCLCLCLAFACALPPMHPESGCAERNQEDILPHRGSKV